MDTTPVIVGHLSPDIDCLCAIWILRRWYGMADAALRFVPSGQTLDGAPVDSDDLIVHVDTGHGRFDHHHDIDHSLSATELVRRVAAPDDIVLKRIAQAVTRLDHALAEGGTAPNICNLIEGFNALYPDAPEQVAAAMFANFDAWYASEARQTRLEQAFAARIEFDTPWGFGIAMESDDGGSSRLAYSAGAVLYAYRDGKGNMGIAARSRAQVDLTQVLRDLRRIDPQADWFLHPSKRMLLCGTPKSPPRTPSRLSLAELVGVLRGDHLF
ncbi:MAG TPA: hypothetical protein VFZ66_25430 [Herpetosiphonaceae bacterium]